MQILCSTPHIRALVLLTLFSAAPLTPAQTSEGTARLVVQPVDNAHLTTLRGTVHPLAQARYDQGAVEESSPATHLLLLLNRPPARDAAFRQYLQSQQSSGSPDFHRWLTPAQIASRFGGADSDLQAVTAWLAASGFSIDRVSHAKRFVEFSGTIGAVNSAFHTQIHQYLIDGVTHRANATELRVPEALAPAIAAVGPMNDFRAASQLQNAGTAAWNSTARKIVPTFTGGPSWSPLLYAIAPADFATQYDLNPLYNAGTNGTGITIGIINESNIDLSQVAAYRSVFGLPANPAQVVIDGSDPGPNSAQGEAYLDVELAGAVAPNATVDLYISADSSLQDPLVDAAVRAVDDNQADILSLSFGEGEEEMTSADSQFWNALWEEAAAQGQTVLVSTGDYGQAADLLSLVFEGEPAGNPGVNGLASTPWDVAVGGTDFYYSDYATGAASSANDWNSTNDATTKASLKASLPEQVWNDPFGLDAISDGLARSEIYAGGGGPSRCITQDSNGNCTAGYPKPAWQSGPGVPADGARDVPDVSLFASNGANYSAYADCDSEGDCTPDASGNFNVDLVGGTSASAPAMAGIMALVDQRYGRQGQADFTLYALAAQTSAAFHDVTLGGNQDICATGDSDCTLNVDGLGPDAGESTVYAAGPGYDRATGLGSVDANQLVNNWGALSFAATSTSLQVSAPAVVHGSSVTISTSVAADGGSGTPTGAVALLTTSALPSSASQTVIPLAAGQGSVSLNTLPGGTYQLTGRYSGDSTFASSTSSPVTLIVHAEPSALNLSIANPNGTSAIGAGITYGSAYTFNAQPVSAHAASGTSDGVATGNVVFTLDSAATSAALNAGGVASINAPLLSVGSHTLNASYAGDASYGPSNATPDTFTVGKGMPWISLDPTFAIGDDGMGDTLYAGANITVSAEVGSYSGPVFANATAAPGTQAPTGTVTFKIVNGNSDPLGLGCQADNTGYAQTATLSSAAGLYAQYSTATTVFSNVAAGFYNLCAVYSGDANWQSWGELILNYFNVTAPSTPAAATTTTLSITPNSISGSQFATITATVTAPAGSTVAPTGLVSFLDNNAQPSYLNLIPLVPAPSGATASAFVNVAASYLWTTGQNQITAVYSGDSNYLPSTSAPSTITVGAQDGQDFTLSPQTAEISVASGGSAASGVNLVSVNNFSSTVAFTCTTSSSDFTCSVNPASLSLNGTATAGLTITAVKSGSAPAQAAAVGNNRALRYGATFALSVVLLLPLGRRSGKTTAILLLLAVVVAASGCGSKSAPPPPPNPNNTPAGTYSILVTATAGTVVHNAKIAVLVTPQS